MSLTRRIILCSVPTLVAVAAICGPAFAHIDPDPVEAPAGSVQSVGFTVQHGCEGSPTVELRMRLPEGAANPTPEAPAGWTGAVDGNVVSFTGGPLADDIEETFRVRMVLPLTPGATIYFPFVQRCEVGEIAWIDIPSDGSGAELDEPAPAMTLTAALPGTSAVPATTMPATTMPATTMPATTMASTTTVPVTTTTVPATTTAASDVVSTDAAETTTPNTTSASTAPVTASTEEIAAPISTTAGVDGDDGTGGGGTIVLVVVLVVIFGGGAIVLVRARRSR